MTTNKIQVNDTINLTETGGWIGHNLRIDDEVFEILPLNDTRGQVFRVTDGHNEARIRLLRRTNEQKDG